MEERDWTEELLISSLKNVIGRTMLKSEAGCSGILKLYYFIYECLFIALMVVMNIELKSREIVNFKALNFFKFLNHVLNFIHKSFFNTQSTTTRATRFVSVDSLLY